MFGQAPVSQVPGYKDKSQHEHNMAIISCATTMEEVNTFLESSTIHGLAYIAVTRKYARLLWTLIVFVGFTYAVFMIYQSFQDWQDNPVKTTIDIRRIEEITFPKVTVCPPKNTYTDLNYDLMMTEDMILDHETRYELANYANDTLYNTYEDSNWLQVWSTFYNDLFKTETIDKIILTLNRLIKTTSQESKDAAANIFKRTSSVLSLKHTDIQSRLSQHAQNYHHKNGDPKILESSEGML